MKAYPSYRDSGVEWIGDIPSHWESIRLKYIGFLYGGLSGKSGKDFSQDDNPNSKPFIPFTNICDNTYISRHNLGKVNILEDDNQRRVKQYDLFFLMSSEDQEGIGKSSVLRDDLGEIYLNTFCRGFRITDEEHNSFFVNYLLSGHSYRELLRIEGRGFTRINLRSHKVSDFQILFPPLPEQQQIVSFLDHKTQLIDELIENTKKKIELLKEKRTSLINHCVTKGLNPNVETKDSGVEWIGEIPSEWGFPRIRYVTSIGYGSSLKEEDRIDGEYDVYGSNGIVGTHHNSLTNGKTIIIGRKGSYGKMNLSQNPCYPIDTTFFIEQENTKNDIKWLFYGLGVLKLDSFTKDSSVPGINREEIYERYLPTPPLKEQQQIVEYLDEQTRKIGTTIEKETQRIELLKEYRQSLISEVVTGKIDVREEMVV